MIPVFDGYPIVNYSGANKLTSLPVGNPNRGQRIVQLPLIFTQYQQASQFGLMGFRFNLIGQNSQQELLPGGILGVILDTTTALVPAGNYSFIMSAFAKDNNYMVSTVKQTVFHGEFFTSLQEIIIYCQYLAPAPGPSLLANFPPVQAFVTNFAPSPILTQYI